jgi:hypothetical protein
MTEHKFTEGMKTQNKQTYEQLNIFSTGNNNIKSNNRGQEITQITRQIRNIISFFILSIVLFKQWEFLNVCFEKASSMHMKTKF